MGQVESDPGGILPSQPVARLIALSCEDEGLRTLMLQIGLLAWHGHAGQVFGWGSLYKVYDTVKTLAGERKLSPYGHVSLRRIEAFAAACNNMSVLRLARLGLTTNKPPKSATTDLDAATRDMMVMARVLLPPLEDLHGNAV